MKKTFIVFFLLVSAAVMLNASVTQAQFQPANIIEQQEGFDTGEIPSNINSSVPMIAPDQDNYLTSQKPPETYTPEWYNDLLVTNECICSMNITKLATDYDQDGYVYVALVTNHTGNDTLWVLQSTDGGHSWNKGWETWIYATDLDIISYDMRIQKGTANPFIYLAVIYVHANDTICTYRRVNLDQSVSEWYEFTGHDDLKHVEIDITDEANPHIYLVYSHPSSSGFYLRRYASADGGANWSSGTVTSGQKEATGFDICAGPDDQAYLFWHRETDDALSVARYINYFTSVGGFEYLNTVTTLYYDVYIASARHNSYPTNYVHAVYQDGTNNSSATRSWEIMSSDGGQNFSAATHFLVGDNWAIHPFVACTRCGTSDQFVGYVTHRFSGEDSVMAGYKSAQAAGWGNLGYFNDYRATGETTPQGNYILTGLGGGMYLIYREYASNNIWYDRASYTSGVEETPAPVVNIHSGFNQMMFTVNFPSETSGKLMVFDLTGRNINTLYQGRFSQGENSFRWDYLSDDISSGTYIMLLTTPENSYSHKFTILN